MVLGDEEPANVTPQPSAVVNRKQRVEYRDQHGNILDEEKVLSLKKEGKVSFETRYEKRTRLVDAQGQELYNEESNDRHHAPPHPDVEGQNPETVKRGDEVPAPQQPASVAGEEKSIKDADVRDPKPASEGKEATKKN